MRLIRGMTQDFEWKTVNMTVIMTGDEMRWLHRIPVAEPWWRRVLIRFGLAKQRSNEPTYKDLFYGDTSVMESKVFDGVAKYLEGKR